MKIPCIIGKTILAISVASNILLSCYFFFVMAEIASGLMFTFLSIFGIMLLIRIKEIKYIGSISEHKKMDETTRK